MNTLIKICGMTEAENIRQVEELGVDLIGFIFYPYSPRCVCELPAYLPLRAGRVGVFVNEHKENVLMYADRFGLEYVQLHGNETPDYCHAIQNSGLHVIKTFSIATGKDLAAISSYEGLCNYYLFDTKCPQFGGSGNQFDWSLLQRYRGTTPFLLSGGLNLYSAKAIRQFRHPRFAGIDLNSRFEIRPGVKDVERIRQFIHQIKNEG